jgi:hypothetical protein
LFALAGLKGAEAHQGHLSFGFTVFIAGCDLFDNDLQRRRQDSFSFFFGYVGAMSDGIHKLCLVHPDLLVS